jgi:uncharacterized phage protein (predicted DNA packaging)
MSVVTLADLKRHLNITFDDDDALLANKLAAAKQAIAGFIGAPLDSTTFPEETYPDGIPEPLCEAVRQLAAHFYENREPVLIGESTNQVPFGIFDLVGPYRGYVF